MRRSFATLSILIFAAACGGPGPAAREGIVSAKPLDPPSLPGPGAPFSVFLEVRVRPGYHVNSSSPGDEFLYPASVELDAGGGLQLERAVFPEGRRVDVAFSRGPVSVLDGTFQVELRLKLDPEYRGQSVELKGSFRFQACDDKTCLPPTAAPFTKTLRVKSR